ncbi:Aste57867_2408 [Aphanomyces stellatus]|uniref:Aste57867_2408 protein n=1 Tax=Aphanomyces stellatus TaxID=120398 RepID=A0A485K8Y3_9STRA|nr:hypothetical protein As57867_002402 [Aphanomyces stellatus]VFT79609.1 Aste57867_2408 [Aphanomyces stellatus]
MEATLGRMLDDVKPDIVVFSGDQIQAMSRLTTNNAAGPIRAYSKYAIARKLPWAMVFGNLDERKDTTLVTNNWAQMDLIQSLPLAYPRQDPRTLVV